MLMALAAPEFGVLCTSQKWDFLQPHPSSHAAVCRLNSVKLAMSSGNLLYKATR